MYNVDQLLRDMENGDYLTLAFYREDDPCAGQCCKKKKSESENDWYVNIFKTIMYFWLQAYDVRVYHKWNDTVTLIRDITKKEAS